MQLPLKRLTPTRQINKPDANIIASKTYISKFNLSLSTTNGRLVTLV